MELKKYISFKKSEDKKTVLLIEALFLLNKKEVIARIDNNNKITIDKDVDPKEKEFIEKSLAFDLKYKQDVINKLFKDFESVGVDLTKVD